MIQVSNSELRAFQWCLRHWWLAYYLGLATLPENERPVGEAKLGTRVHLALEVWYGFGVDPLKALRKIYDLEREAHPAEFDVERLNKEQDLALIMVEGYMEWVAETGSDEGLQLISVEEDLIVPSGIPGVEFRAKLDQRVLRTFDNARMFIDHKTTGNFDNTTVMMAMDPQMRFYALLDLLDAKRSGLQGPRVDGGIWNMLRRSKRTDRAKPPFYKREEIRFNLDELRSTWIKANSVAGRLAQIRQELDKGPGAYDHRHLVPPNPSRDCSWKCQFVSICPMFDDGSNVGAAVRDQYIQHDPYSYYVDTAQPLIEKLKEISE